MSASKMNARTTVAQNASNVFWSMMDKEVGSNCARSQGENGADQHGLLGMAGENASQLQGAFVAAFGGLCRGCSAERAREFLRNIETEAKARGGKTLQNAMATLIVMVWQLRDCRGGKGEKALFHVLLMALYRRFPKSVTALMPLVPEYGYWKDFQHLIQNCHESNRSQDFSLMTEECYRLMAEQLKDDRATLDDWEENKGKPGCPKMPKLSLAAKYTPKEDRALDKKCGAAKKMAEHLFPELYQQDRFTAMAAYRRFYAPLQKAIKTTETLMSANKWDEIEFVLVPGRLLNICRRAFLNLKGGKKCKEDTERSTEESRRTCKANLLKHFERAEKGEVKIHGAKSLDPHEIVGKFMSQRLSEDEKRLLTLQFKAHVETMREKIEKDGIPIDQVLTMADVSGSMAGTPMEVAISFAIMLSELMKAPYGDKFISFAEKPMWIELQPDWSLEQKVNHAKMSKWGMTTDFLAVHDMILALAIKHQLQPEQLPLKFIVLSDMQFNQAAKSCGSNTYSTLSSYADQKLLNTTRNVSTSSYSSSSYCQQTMNFQTHHQILVEAYRKVGLSVCGKPYQLPETVYWNLRGDTCGAPVQADTPNTRFISGFNASLIPLALGEIEASDYTEPEKQKPPTPWDTFVMAMDNERYDPIHKVLAETGEGVFAGYQPPVRESEQTTEESKESEPNEDKSSHFWEIGDRVNAEDHRGKRYDGEIVEMREESAGVEELKVHFDKFSDKWDEWYPTNSPKVWLLASPEDLRTTQSPPPAPKKHTDNPLKWTSSQVSDWVEGFEPFAHRRAVDEGIDGSCLDIIVKADDRESLKELGVKSGLKQTRLIRDWKAMTQVDED